MRDIDDHRSERAFFRGKTGRLRNIAREHVELIHKARVRLPMRDATVRTATSDLPQTRASVGNPPSLNCAKALVSKVDTKSTTRLPLNEYKIRRDDRARARF